MRAEETETEEGRPIGAPPREGTGALRPLRVALVSPYDLSRPGGVQGQVRGLADALRRLGLDALVIAPDDRPPGWATGHVYVAGRSVAVRANGSVAPVALSPLAARRAVGAAKEWGAEVVHLHEPLAPVLGYGFLARKQWPIVATFHRSGPAAFRAAAPVARWARSRMDRCFAVSPRARDTAVAICGGSYELLFNGVDLARFARARPAASEVPAVLFLGRHEPRKGLGVLLEAFAGLSSPAALWVAGDGPETGALRARYPECDRVHWLGVVSEGEVASRLQGASVLCAPSLGGESFGMVLVEAMAARCAVVASDIEGYREAAGGHAVLVPPGDVASLRAALERVLSSPPTDGSLSAAAAHAAGWSIERLAGCYADAYRRARAQSRAGGIVAGR